MPSMVINQNTKGRKFEKGKRLYREILSSHSLDP